MDKPGNPILPESESMLIFFDAGRARFRLTLIISVLGLELTREGRIRVDPICQKQSRIFFLQMQKLYSFGH